MKKLLIAFALLVGTTAVGHAQCPGNPSSTAYPTLDSWVTSRSCYFTGPTEPPVVNCVQGRDIYTVSTNGHVYDCATTNTWVRRAPLTAVPCPTLSSLGFLLNGTDETTLMNTVLTNGFNAGATCLSFDSGKTLRTDGQIVTPSASSGAFLHPPITFRCSTYGLLNTSDSGGCGWDMRFSGTSVFNGGPKLLIQGAGTVLIEGITFQDGSSDAAAYIQVAAGSAFIRGNSFLQSTGGTGARNDAVIRGGGGTPGVTWAALTTSGSGSYDNNYWYGKMVMEGNRTYARRLLLSQSSAGSGTFSNNWCGGSNTSTGSTSDHSCFASVGFGTGANASRSDSYIGNTAIMSNYTSMFFLQNTENANFYGNSAFNGAGSTYTFDGDSTATKNSIDKSNFVDSTGGTLASPGLGINSNNYWPWKPLSFTFDGGGSALTGTATRCAVTPVGGKIVQFSMFGDQTGSATVTVSSSSIASYTGPGSAVGISGSGETMSGAVSLQDSTLTGWTTTLAPNTVVCMTLASSSAVTWLNGNVQIWEGR